MFGGAAAHSSRHSNRVAVSRAAGSQHSRDGSCATLQPGDVFVDIGANSGYFALLAAARGCRVGAVEACPTTFEVLRSNLALNGPLGGRVRAMQLAAGEAAGNATLYQHRNEPLYNTTVRGAGAGGVAAATDVWAVLQKSAALDAAAASAVSALAAERACWREVQVPQASLDDVLAGDERAPRVVKIDVEGGEWAVLRGMESILRQNDASIELSSSSPKWLKLQSTSARALLDYMRERGFHAYALPADDYEIARRHDAPPTAPPRPRRLHAAEAERLDAAADGAQLDVIFSRRDAEWLKIVNLAAARCNERDARHLSPVGYASQRRRRAREDSGFVGDVVGRRVERRDQFGRVAVRERDVRLADRRRPRVRRDGLRRLAAEGLARGAVQAAELGRQRRHGDGALVPRRSAAGGHGARFWKIARHRADAGERRKLRRHLRPPPAGCRRAA